MYLSSPLTNERPPAVNIMRTLQLEPDPWQIDVLENRHRRLLLNCCRQAGKSTVVAILALCEAMFNRLSKVLIVSRSHRQSRELLRTITFFHKLLGDRLLERRSADEIEFKHLSRIVSMPCREDTIRGYAGVDLLIVDEAARVPDDLYRAIRPMLAISKGRLVCLSTPYGKRGFFWNAWARGGDDWARIEIPASKCPRIEPAYLDEERRALGDAWFRQEYDCSFESVEGLVYPDFARCVVPELPANVRMEDRGWRIEAGNSPSSILHPQSSILHPPSSFRKVGGMDFGFRDPFAAVWGLVDRDHVLWLVGEHYQRQQPLSHHAQYLPREVMWQADPSGAGEIAELRIADFKVLPANNAIRLGIAAVTRRLRDGTLKILAGRCPNLLAEAGLYRWADATRSSGGESPEDDHNHALDALRYLLMGLDSRRLARPQAAAVPIPAPTPAALAAAASGRKPIREMMEVEWLREDSLWTSLD